MEASVRFLRSYVDSLIGINLNPRADPAKGKACIVYDRPARVVKPTNVADVKRWCAPELGWNKLNTDGSFVSSEVVGAGMIFQNHQGVINFSVCRSLFSC